MNNKLFSEVVNTDTEKKPKTKEKIEKTSSRKQVFTVHSNQHSDKNVSKELKDEEMEQELSPVIIGTKINTAPEDPHS